MSSPAGPIVAVPMPQINVNDEEVTLVGWRAGDGEGVVQGQPLAEVETSKSVDEIPAPAGGVVRYAARTGDRVRVGAVFAYIGPSAEAIDAHLAGAGAGTVEENRPASQVTAGAVVLARRYGLDPSKIPARGGTLRREDVEQWVRDSGAAGVQGPGAAAVSGQGSAEETLPRALLNKVAEPAALSDHQSAVAQHLSRTRARLVPAHVAMDVNMQPVVAWMKARRKAGVMTGPLPIVLWAVGAA